MAMKYKIIKKSFGFLICAVLILSLIEVVIAVDPLSSVGDQINSAEQAINDIPKTPEGIADKYLKKEWDKIIIENKIYGPVHRFFLNNQFVFRAFFNEEYAFSLTFLVSLIIWVFLMTLAADAMYTFGFLKRFWSLVFGLCVSVLVAKTGVIHKLVSSLIYFVSSREAWWMRVLAWLAFLAILIYLGYLIHGAGKMFAERKKKREENEREFKLKKTEAFIEGVEKGQEMAEEISPGRKRNVGFKKTY